MSPPELARYAPVADVVHPVEIHALAAFGHKLDITRSHRLNRGLGKALHRHEPLLGDNRLHRGVAAVAVTHVVLVVIDLNEQAKTLNLVHDLLSCVVLVNALVFAAEAVDIAAVIKHADYGQDVALGHLKVVRVVRGRDLDRTRAELHVHIFVRHNGYRPVHDGQYHIFAHQMRIAFVLGIHGDSGIAEHRFRPCGRHGDAFTAVLRRIAEMPQM